MSDKAPQNSPAPLSAMNTGRREFFSKSVTLLTGGTVAAQSLLKPVGPALAQDTSAFFPGFQQTKIETSGATINLRTGGSGPPVLLLHGYPQTHFEWHKVAPELAKRFTVVAADLRGYGDSSKPPAGENLVNYSKPAMARDMAEVMERLGHRQFAVVGHDRGGRVAHRLAIDYPERVTKLTILDIITTLRMFQTVNKEFATRNFHWFFLAQPAPFPEQMISSNPEAWLARAGQKSPFIVPEAYAEYLRCLRNPETARAMCEDYRANASIDLQLDAADLAKKILCPLLVLWGEKGGMTRFDVLAEWRERANDVRGRAVPSTHWIPEEVPAMLLAELGPFLNT